MIARQQDHPAPDQSPDHRLPTLGVSMGDPLGIGPEVTVKALADRSLRARARFLVFGMGAAMHAAAQKAGIEPFWWRAAHDSPALETTGSHDVVLIDYDDPRARDDRASGPDSGAAPLETRGRPTKAGGAASFRFVEDAIQAARSPAHAALRVDAIVTAPISKEAWAMAGRSKYPGHTELLATRFGATRSRMMFVAPQLRVILATTHIPLMDIRNTLTIGRVFDTIDLGAQACRRLGVEKPRIAVCGLNPHAGENGLMGDEESRIIEPAIRLAQEQGIDAQGPFPGDTIFNAAVKGHYDLVVAMYHDQGLIPVKLLAFDCAVNATIGLPVVRTSPDHGTAYDIAGRNLADPGSMKAAIDLAITLSAAPCPTA